MFVPLFPFPVPIPLIGEQLLPPNRAALPRHGLTAESVILSSPGEKKDRFTHLSQSGKSVWVGGRNPIEGVRLAAGGAKRPPQQVQGRSPWRAFGDFPRVGKVTRGGGAERPPHRGVQRGLRPLASSGPEGRSALHLRDCAPRIKTKTILDSSAGLRYTGKKENRRNHHVRKKTGPQRPLLVRQPEKI